MARAFPDDFKKEIPNHAIALVATTVCHLLFLFIVLITFQMRHCLQRYESGMYIDGKFEGVIQNSVYSRMLALISEVSSNQYHKAKHNNNRRKWARLGM